MMADQMFKDHSLKLLLKSAVCAVLQWAVKEAVKMVGNASLSMELWSAFVLLAGQDQDAKKVGISIYENIFTD